MLELNQIKFIELFAGIGGFRYGLEKANKMFQFTTKKPEQTEPKVQFRGKRTSVERGRDNILFGSEQSNGYRCVYANEWDRYAAKIYEKNFGEKPDTRDITTVDANEIPDHDLLTAGFPCQAFSIAGKRKGFDDTRGTLFFEIGRVLRHKKPGYFILENVAGLLSHDEGRTFEIIIISLNELGYDVQWQVHNSKNWVPQNRERVFIIGHIRGERRPEIFPFRNSNQEINQTWNEQCISGTISTKNQSGQAQFDGSTTLIVNAIDSNYFKGIDNHKQRTGVIVREQFDVSGKGYNFEDFKIRRLTPVECERLQGFPDNWTEGVSDTQRYKMLGNAVTTNVITEIGKRLANIYRQMELIK